MKKFPYGVSETRGFYRCQCPTSHLVDPHKARLLINMVDEAGFTVMGEHIQSFAEGGGGYTLNVTLGESGAAFDCWPQEGEMKGHTVWVFLDYCNYTADNSAKAAKFWELVESFFLPAEKRVLVVPTVLPVDID